MDCLLRHIPYPVLTGPMDVTLSHLTVIYAITAFLSLVLLAGCFLVTKKKGIWLKILFCSVLVVNAGYLQLSASQNLSQALNANRLAYLGSVFLPLSMLMIILQVSRIHYPRWLPKVLIGIGFVVFLIAATPGILPIYYKEVTYSRAAGVVVLDKVYGPLHSLYLVYLLGYFASMVAVIVRSVCTEKIESTTYASILAAAVFVNIAVWLVEQFLANRFEYLAVSYIISELFLLGLHLLMAEVSKKAAAPAPIPEVTAEQLELFAQGLQTLTPKEREIYECHLKGMATEQILKELQIKENTLKFHNKNLYGKLGVKSKKQIRDIHRILP